MNATIMCVDDEQNLLRLYEQVLAEDGYSIVLAHNGIEALDIIHQQPVDLVVLDIKMDDKDGLEVLREMKMGNPDLPVILHSAYSTYKSDFKSWLAVDYLVKSADLAPLRARIRELLGAND
jgi:two-component system response regulator (stage 0 sporulation protein F)